jgi:membrane-associated PAP2 superfamily phosphatase
MTTPKTFWTVWGIGLAIWTAALAVLAPWDLEISSVIADREAALGRLVALAGEWPAWAATAACVVVLILGRKPDSSLRAYRPLALAVILLAIISPLIITQSFKFLWGRVRFRDLGVDFAGYTPFYIPAGPGAGLSFPSGHVTMAFVVTPIVFFLARLRGAIPALIALAGVLLYGCLTAFGRIQAGAHYLTDCIFSAGLSFLLAAVLVRRLTGGARNPRGRGARPGP